MNWSLLEKCEHPGGFFCSSGGIRDRKRSRETLKEPSVPRECLKTCQPTGHSQAPHNRQCGDGGAVGGSLIPSKSYLFPCGQIKTGLLCFCWSARLRVCACVCLNTGDFCFKGRQRRSGPSWTAWSCWVPWAERRQGEM